MWLENNESGEISQVMSVDNKNVTHKTSKLVNEVTPIASIAATFKVLHRKPEGVVELSTLQQLSGVWLPIVLADKKAEHVLVNDTNENFSPWVSARHIESVGWSGWAYSDETMSDVNPAGPNPTHFYTIPPLLVSPTQLKKYDRRYSDDEESQKAFTELMDTLDMIAHAIMEYSPHATTTEILGYSFWLEPENDVYALKFSPDGKGIQSSVMEPNEIEGLSALELNEITKNHREWLANKQFVFG